MNRRTLLKALGALPFAPKVEPLDDDEPLDDEPAVPLGQVKDFCTQGGPMYLRDDEFEWYNPSKPFVWRRPQ